MNWGLGWIRRVLGWAVPALRKTAAVAESVAETTDELADHAEWTRATLPESDPVDATRVPVAK